MQLVAYGAQDVYLTGNPQVTFFKQLYRRHTNFAMQAVEAGFNGNPDFGKRVSLVVPRIGDLMSRVYLVADLPKVTVPQRDDYSGQTVSWVPEVGHFLIKYVEVQIGGQTIDKHYGVWLSIWADLTVDMSKRNGYYDMIGDYNFFAFATNTRITNGNEIDPRRIYVPLQFWFCKHEGLALPLIALQYHEVRFVVEFEEAHNLIRYTGIPTNGDDDAVAIPLPSTDITNNSTTFDSLSSAKLYIDYIFLDTDERRKFAQTSHEYLIDQLQFTGDEQLNPITGGQIKLNFNHPVKELIWIILASNEETNTKLNNQYEINGLNPVKTAKLQFNGHDRFSERNGEYFNYVQPWQHHTNIPTHAGINVYSFALYPELEQPSGTSNFSRIDNSTLTITVKEELKDEQIVTATAKVFACNYNVLRIMSGMGGLAYSN